MCKINTYEKALSKIEEIKNHKDVTIATLYNPDDKNWEYYFYLAGWFNGNYFLLYLTGYQGIYKIEVPKHVNDKVTLFKKQFKLY